MPLREGLLMQGFDPSEVVLGGGSHIAPEG
jgi:hypothetical protein